METCKEGERKACVLSLIKNHEHQPISTSLFLYSSVIHHILSSSIHTDVKPKHNSANMFLLQNHGQAQKASTMQCRISYLSHCATKQMIKKHIKNLPKYICTDFKNLLIPPASHFNLIFIVKKHHPNPWYPLGPKLRNIQARPASCPHEKKHDDSSRAFSRLGGCVLIER